MNASKKLLSLLLCLVLLLSLAPLSALAEEPGEEDVGLIEPIPPEPAEPEAAAEPEPEIEALPGDRPAAGSLTHSGTLSTGQTWKLYSDGTLMITGSGAMPDFKAGSMPPWKDYSSDITRVEIGSGVTTIGNLSFHSVYSNLDSVSIPGSVTRIGNYAFDDCTSLSSLTLPLGLLQVGNWAFSGCKNLTGLSLPDTLQSIGDHAFQNCLKLDYVYLPGDLVSVGDGAFANCSSLEGFQLSTANPYFSILGGALYNSSKTVLLAVPSGMSGSFSAASATQEFRPYALANCRNIDSVTIPDSVTVLGSYCFYNCYGLVNVVLPLGVTELPEAVFMNCINLETVSLGSNVTRIGLYAFDDCQHLAQINLPSKLSEIGNKAFANCQRLAYLQFTGHAPAFGGDAVFSSASPYIYYPGSDRTWTDDLLTDYGGSPVWVPEYPQSAAPTIVTDPVNASSRAGYTVLFRVEASGGGLQYHWQTYNPDTRVWEDVTGSGIFGQDCPVLQVRVAKALDCRMFRCLVSNSYGSTISGAALLYLERIDLGAVTVDLTNGRWYAAEREFWAMRDTLFAAYKLGYIGYEGGDFDLDMDGTRDVLAYNSNLSLAATSANSIATVFTLTASSDIRDYVYENGHSHCCYFHSITFIFHDVFPTVTKQPVSVTLPADSSVNFSVHADGTNLIYQWQYRSGSGDSWHDCSGEGFDTTVYNVTALPRRSGYQYRCKVSNSAGTVFSSPATLTVMCAPTVTTQPKSVTVTEGATAKFTVTAVGAASYQWQWRSGSSGTWADSTRDGNKTATLSVPATAARNGQQYRCRISNSYGTTISSSATLTVTAAKPTITTQPKSVTVAEGATAKFTVTAGGSGLSYQWQWRSGSSGTWADSTRDGNKTATLSVPATAARNGQQYRCRVTNSAGTVNSGAATLTVVTKPTVSTQPKSVTAYKGMTAKFTVAAKGGSLSYQWQWRSGSSGTWTNCTSATTGYNKATLEVVAAESRSGYQYRCKISNAAGSVTSSTATLTVSVKPVIVTQPKNVTAAEGSTATFYVGAQGVGSYQWQWRSGSSGTWADSTRDGNKSATLSVPATAARNGQQYRCKITNSKGTTISNTVTLTVVTKPSITTQPKSLSVTAGSTAKFTVAASGTGLSYRWQWRSGSSGTWTDCTSATVGYNKATLQVSATAGRNGYQYRCKITNAAGTTYSNAATLTVK